VPYDPEQDFAPIASVSSSYGIVAARKDLPASNMAELVALARKDPGKLTFGSAGTATATHLSGEIVHSKAGIKVLHVPYKGSAESLNDLVGGRIDLIYDPVALVQIKAGNLKALGVTSAVRHPELPAVPTLKEQGLEVPGGSWFGLFAPRGTPPEVINRVAAEVDKAMAAPGVREQLVKFSQFPEFRGPAAFTAEIRADSAFYKDLIQRLGIKVE
jgi:tripartite-type tricarboxylate transporter receptor subunit TctC